MGRGQEAPGTYFSVNTYLTGFPKHLGRRKSQVCARAPSSAVVMKHYKTQQTAELWRPAPESSGLPSPAQVPGLVKSESSQRDFFPDSRPGSQPWLMASVKSAPRDLSITPKSGCESPSQCRCCPQHRPRTVLGEAVGSLCCHIHQNPHNCPGLPPEQMRLPPSHCLRLGICGDTMSYFVINVVQGPGG